MTYDPTKSGSLRSHQEELADDMSALIIRILTGNCTSLSFETGRRIALMFGCEEYDSSLTNCTYFSTTNDDRPAFILSHGTNVAANWFRQEELADNAKEIRRLLQYKLGSPGDF